MDLDKVSSSIFRVLYKKSQNKRKLTNTFITELIKEKKQNYIKTQIKDITAFFNLLKFSKTFRRANTQNSYIIYYIYYICKYYKYII